MTFQMECLNCDEHFTVEDDFEPEFCPHCGSEDIMSDEEFEDFDDFENWDEELEDEFETLN